jgi:hypothetical protein
MLNKCLDDAIAGAVTEFGREQNQFTLEGETARGNARAGFLAHELQNLLNTALSRLATEDNNERIYARNLS